MADLDVESLWTKLHRRKVVQWGIAYGVGAWGLLQGLEYVTDTFHWPEQLQQVATLGLLVGLPVVLVVAWYHGDRGEQRVTSTEFLIITLLFLVGGGIFWRYDTEDDRRGAATVSPTIAAPVPTVAAAEGSIAVLPFVNMSGDPANEYFSDGVSEEILNVLARTPELQVAARTSSFAFKGKTQDIPQIARDLRVRMVLEGSVRRQGDRVRITAQLIDAGSGFHVWSETYDRELEDIFAIQDEIARAIGDKMKVQIVRAATGDAANPGTKNLQAYDHYLRGLALWQMRREAELWQAVESFEHAIAEDVNFASAHAGLGLVYAVIADYSARISHADAATRATDAAEIALALDPSLPEPYAALGSVAGSERRRAAERALFERALALRPSFATAYQWLGTGTMAGGDPAAGLTSLERAIALDPRSRVVGENYAFVLMSLDRHADALAACERVLAFAPDYFYCHLRIGFVELLRRDFEAARPSLLSAAEDGNPSAVPLVNELIDTLEGRGDRLALTHRLAAFPPLSYLEQGSGNIFSDAEIPALLVLLGAPDLALRYIEQNASDRFGTLQWGMALPALDPIRCEARFRAVAKKLAFDDKRAATVCT